jgi:hypothetical protein
VRGQQQYAQTYNNLHGPPALKSAWKVILEFQATIRLSAIAQSTFSEVGNPDVDEFVMRTTAWKLLEIKELHMNRVLLLSKSCAESKSCRGDE